MSRGRYEVSTDFTNPLEMNTRYPPGEMRPMGLEILRSVSTLLVKQRPSVAEAVTGIAMKAKFDIYTENQERILHAFEDSGFCQRCCCSGARQFILHVMTNSNQEVMTVRRDFSCCAGCCWCSYCEGCQQEITVEAPPGQVIGMVRQVGSCWRMHYVLHDINGANSLTIMGPTCICDGALCCCCENKFSILGNDGSTEIGEIKKTYSGFFKEAYTSADNYRFQVPMDLDLKMKIVTLGALFLIDFTNFSTVPKQNDN